MPSITVSKDLKYFLIAFDKNGKERDESEGKMSQQLLQILSSEPITDVFLMSHGWLSDVGDARN